jgi:hypothetical protein
MAFSSSIKSVWIIPFEVAGYGSGLQKGFNSLGYKCEFLNLPGNSYSYHHANPDSRIAKLLWSWHKIGLGRRRPIRFLVGISSVPVRIIFAFLYFRKNTLIISLYGNSLLKGLDLVLARALGACVVTVFLGSDSRPPYISAVFVNSEKVTDLKLLNRQTRRIAGSVRRAERNSDLVVCSPSTAHFLRHDFVNWFHIGMPSSHSLVHPRDKAAYLKSKQVKIAHIPSRPKIKGTSVILNAIKDLESEGIDFEFYLVQNESNAKVQETIADMDLVIDELYSDSFMGGLGAEAAAAGVACLTFGLAEQELRSWAHGTDAPLGGFAHSSLLAEKIKWAILDTTGRVTLATAQHDFYQLHWGPEVVARRFLKLASGDFPNSWNYSPQDINYLWGYGLSKDTLLVGLRSYVNEYGLKGLLLDRGSPLLTKIKTIMSSDLSRYGS